MTRLQLGVYIGAALCVLVAIVIAYRKIWIPWADERAWRRENIRKNDMFAKQISDARKRAAATQNGRTDRRTPGDRNVAS